VLGFEAEDPVRSQSDSHVISAAKEKLDEARHYFDLLREEGQPLSPGQHFIDYLSAFLSAGRSVTFVLQKDQKESYDSWFPGWLANDLTENERALFNFMKDQRNAALKTGRIDIEVTDRPIPMAQFMQEISHRGWQIFMQSGVPGTPYPEQIGKARTFAALGDQDVVAACSSYLTLLVRLIADFEQANAGAT
jgi:hypothetical protein